jgi:hypothetical protein
VSVEVLDLGGTSPTIVWNWLVLVVSNADRKLTPVCVSKRDRNLLDRPSAGHQRLSIKEVVFVAHNHRGSVTNAQCLPSHRFYRVYITLRLSGGAAHAD